MRDVNGRKDMIPVAIVDDQTGIRQGVRMMLEAEPDLIVVGEACCGMEAIRMAGNIKPAVLVLDLSLGDINGFEVARYVNTNSPQTRIIIFSISGEDCYIRRARQVGAWAYVPKKQPNELVKAIHEVVAGRECYPCPDASLKQRELR